MYPRLLGKDSMGVRFHWDTSYISRYRSIKILTRMHRCPYSCTISSPVHNPSAALRKPFEPHQHHRSSIPSVPRNPAVLVKNPYSTLSQVCHVYFIDDMRTTTTILLLLFGLHRPYLISCRMYTFYVYSTCL